MRDAFYLGKIFDARPIFLEKNIRHALNFTLFLSHLYNNDCD